MKQDYAFHKSENYLTANLIVTEIEKVDGKEGHRQSRGRQSNTCPVSPLFVLAALMVSDLVLNAREVG